jgi:hypothetical protein
VNCIDCSGLFVPLGGSGRPRVRCFGCSPAQRKAGPRKPPAWTNPRGACCARCSKGFTAKLPHQRFCSRGCGIAANNRRKQEAARDRSARPCKACGVAFAPSYGDCSRVICSDECREEWDRRRKSGKTHVRRAKHFGVASEHIDREAVFERDGWRCKICGVATPRAAIGTNFDNRPELDHVTPMSLGGPHTWANVQCACHECNAAKRNAASLDEAHCRRMARAAKRNGLSRGEAAGWVRDGLVDFVP